MGVSALIGPVLLLAACAPAHPTPIPSQSSAATGPRLVPAAAPSAPGPAVPPYLPPPVPRPLSVSATLPPAQIAAPPPALGPLTFISGVEGWAGADTGVFQTTDGGRTWTRQLSTSDAVVSVAFASSGEGWAAAGGSIHHTADGGRNWSVLYRGAGKIGSLSFPNATAGWAVSTPPAAGRGSLMHSTDGGATWATAISPCALLVGVSFPTPTSGFVLCAGDGGAGAEGKQVYTTIDGGQTWTEVASAAMGHASVMPALASLGYAQGIGCRDPHACWIAQGGGATGGSLLLSGDGGSQWHAPPGGLPHWETVGGAAFPTATRGYVSGGSGASSVLLDTDDGGQTWAQIWPNLGPLDDGGDGMSLTAAGGGAWAASGAQLLHSVNGGLTWTAAGTLPGYVPAISTGDGRTLFAVTEGATGTATLERSDRVGWTAMPLPPQASPRALSVAADASGWLATASGQVYRTADGGATWAAVQVWTSMHPGPVLDAFAAVSVGEAWGVGRGNLYHFANGTWTADQAPDGLAFVDVAFADAAHGAALADDADHCSWSSPCRAMLFTTTDGGARWAQRPMPGIVPGGLALAGPEVMLLTTARGLLRSSDGGAKWIYPAVAAP